MIKFNSIFITHNNFIFIIIKNVWNNNLVNFIEIFIKSYNIFIATRLGKAIRFDINDVRIFVGRDSSGVRGIKLKPDDFVVSMSLIPKDEEKYVLSVTENGFGKRTLIDDYRRTNRGGQGVANIECSDRNGPVVSSYIVSSLDQIMLVTNAGKLIRMKIHENENNSIRVTGRKTQGVKLFDVDEDEKVMSVALLLESDDENEEENEEENEINKN